MLDFSKFDFPPTRRYLALRLRDLTRWALSELSLLVALTAAALGLWLFASLADEVSEGETHGFDEAVLLAFRVPGQPAEPLGPHWFEVVMVDITALGSTAVLTLITLTVTGFLIMDRKRSAALFVLAATASGGALTYLLKLGFARPRPDLVAHLVDVTTMSFPSGHSMGAAVTYLTLGALIVRTETKRRLKAYVLGVAVGLTLLIGFSRIYLGVHWPTDVLAGWCAGGAWALMCWTLAVVLQRRGQIETDAAAGEVPPPRASAS